MQKKSMLFFIDVIWNPNVVYLLIILPTLLLMRFWNLFYTWLTEYHTKEQNKWFLNDFVHL